MSQMSQSKPAGNTKTAGFQAYRWCLTIPYELYPSASQLSQTFKSFCKEFYFQLEKGEKTGYKHWQCVASLIKKEYMKTVKNMFGDKVHIEACKDWHASINYCSKGDSRLEGPYNHKSTFIDIITELRPWQAELKNDLLEPPDDRTIIWYYDPQGGKGKTRFAKYMAIKHGATILNNGAFKDIAQALPDDPKIVIFNFSRDLQERVNYNAIEAVKDGLVFSAKYESRTKIFNCPHVVIFANFPPDKSRMTADRWDIREL